MTGEPLVPARAARPGALVVHRKSLGRVRLTGKDRQDFLHRLSTNDINALRPGEGTLSAILNPRGRILDLLHVLASEEDLRLVTSEDNGERVRTWLDGYLFREDVSMELEPGEGCLSLCGTDAPRLLARLAAGGWDRLAPGSHRAIQLPGAEVIVAGSYPLDGPSFLILPAPGAAGAARDALLGAGARPAPETALEAFRIAAGIPALGRELSEDYNPWEAGLDRAISLTKGCYLGQEVVARLRTYRKVRRRLSLLDLAGATLPVPGDAIHHLDEAVGRITSSAFSPESGRPIALGFVNVPFDGPGQDLSVLIAGRPCPARVLPPPFFHRTPDA